MATDPVGYGTADDPHGWAWLKMLRDRTPAAPSVAGGGSGVAVTDNGDGTFTITA